MSLVTALPAQPSDSVLSRNAGSDIQVLPADVHGPNTSALQPAPANLPSSLLSFLEKYQPLANAARTEIGPTDEAVFTSAGHCFADFPCFSVERGAIASIGKQEEVTQEQVSALLDSLVSSPTVVFKPNAPSMLSGLKLTAKQATLEVIAAQGTVPSRFLAGMVFDMYKMQHDNPATNSIRAVQAKTDGQERPFVALCLYPEGANATQAHNFCLGNKLDGSPMPATQSKAKRFLIKHGLSLLCGLILVPLLCHENE